MKRFITQHCLNKTINFKKYLFKKELTLSKEKDFCIISSNCIGLLPYQILGLQYNTPTVGLYFFAPCFIKFISNFDYYIGEKLAFKYSSFYKKANGILGSSEQYPIGVLGDIEIHFLHYKNETDAKLKWERRVERINRNNIYFIMTDRDLCKKCDLIAFDSLKYKNKVCFTAKKYDLKSTVQIKKFESQNCVGDLFNKYYYFVGNFKFGKWLSS